MARAITVESVCPLRLQRAPPSVPKLFGLQPITINQVHQLTHLLYDLKFKHLQLGVVAVLHSCNIHAMDLPFYDDMMCLCWQEDGERMICNAALSRWNHNTGRARSVYV